MSDFKTDELLPCRCGFKPDHYSVYYGRTPYDVFCPDCKKQLARAKCLVTGWAGHAIDYWNTHLCFITLEEMNSEVKNFMKEKEKLEEKPNAYDYYWEKGKGEVLYARY